MKKIINIFFPRLYDSLRVLVNKYRLSIEYLYDLNRYFKFSDYYYNDGEIKIIMRIIHRYHPIEKGLTMAEMKLGFGVDNILLLINDCNDYKKLYYKTNSSNFGKNHFLHAVKLLKEYEFVHKMHDFKINQKLQSGLECLLSDIDVTEHSNQLEFTKNEFFQFTNSSFDLFANSRHSLRNFTGSISLDDIKIAISIAQSSPSACNRQPSRVHVLTNREVISNVLHLQGGNRGFGSKIDILLIVTAELIGYRGISERNNVFVDGGIFSMNLLYALHFKKIGACSLNWCANKDKDLELRKLITFSNSQTVIMMIGCGGVPENFKVTSSPKNILEDIIQLH